MFKTPPSTGPYYRYIKNMFQATALDMPSGSPFPTIIKAIHQKWKELPAEDKKQYQDMCLIAQEQDSTPEKKVGASECAKLLL